MPHKAFFVTGTDTGIGKTTVTCAITAALSARGRRVGVAKPCETGCARDATGDLIAADASLLQFFARSNDTLETICPIRCVEPLAPAIALQREERAIDLVGLRATVEGVVARHDVTFIEGAGGLLVPVAPRVTFADLARDWALPLLVIVGNRLGALNHAQLTMRVAVNLGLNVAGYVVNTLSPEVDVATQTNVEALREMLGPSLGVLPYLGTIAPTDVDYHRLAEAAEATLDLAALSY